MKKMSLVLLVTSVALFLGILSCQGKRQQGESDEVAGLAEGDLASPVPGGPFEKGKATLKGQAYEVFIQKTNSKVYYDLDISDRGAFYMKICGVPAEADEEGAVKFDVIIAEGTDSPYTVYGGYLSPLQSLDEDNQLFVNVTVEITKFAGERVDLTMRLIGDEGKTLAWTEPEFRPFPRSKK